VADREEARHWIELRHTGERDGAGIVRWNTEESERFSNRTGGKELHTQALDFLEREGLLTPEQRRSVPVTTLKRLLSAPDVREKMGVGHKDGTLKLLGPANEVAKALLHVVHELTTGKTKTGDVYSKEQRTEYAKNFPKRLVVRHSAEDGPALSSAGGSVAPKRPAAKRPKKIQVRERESLIPRDCVLQVSDKRVRDIEVELRLLKLADFTNAISVLLRVFMELSTDAYIADNSLATTANDSLAKKFSLVADDLVKRKKLTKQQAVPVRRASQKDSFLAPSVTLMHQFVHNKHVFPGPGDLRASWDSLQPFVTAIWSP
jgi:hypothetical protein